MDSVAATLRMDLYQTCMHESSNKHTKVAFSAIILLQR